MSITLIRCRPGELYAMVDQPDGLPTQHLIPADATGMEWLVAQLEAQARPKPLRIGNFDPQPAGQAKARPPATPAELKAKAISKLRSRVAQEWAKKLRISESEVTKLHQSKITAEAKRRYAIEQEFDL